MSSACRELVACDKIVSCKSALGKICLQISTMNKELSPAILSPLLLAKFYSGARFSKVPKLYGPFSGVTIPFVTQERRTFNSSNFTVNFLLVTLKACKNIGFPKQAVAISQMAFRARKVFGTFEKQAPGNKCTCV